MRGRRAQQAGERVGDQLEPCASLPVVYEPGCITSPCEPERLGAIQLVAERGDRLRAQRRRRPPRR